jgi:hypothetical protein
VFDERKRRILLEKAASRVTFWGGMSGVYVELVKVCPCERGQGVFETVAEQGGGGGCAPPI